MTPTPPSLPDTADAPPPERPRYRPPIGVPVGNQRRVRSLLISIGIHLLIIILLIVPFTSPELIREVLGAGGLGPAGGGGGGNRGTGGIAKYERLQFVRIAPAPTPPPALVKPPTLKPIVPPPPPTPPVVNPPPQPAAPTPPSTAAATDAKSVVTGTGGGAGNRRRDVDRVGARSRKRISQDPVLRARQSTQEYRALRKRPRCANDYHRDLI
mgnify:CR=1 FL=1